MEEMDEGVAHIGSGGRRCEKSRYFIYIGSAVSTIIQVRGVGRGPIHLEGTGEPPQLGNPETNGKETLEENRHQVVVPNHWRGAVGVMTVACKGGYHPTT